MKFFMELMIKPARRALVDVSAIKAVFTGEGHDCYAIAPPDYPLTILLNDGTEFETYGISADTIMVQLRAYGKIDGWLALPT